MHIHNLSRLSWSLKRSVIQRSWQNIRCISSTPRVLANTSTSVITPQGGLGSMDIGLTPSTSNLDADEALKDFAKIHKSQICHHLHINSHKRNTHLTLSNQKNEIMISVSAGNLGFRKAKRGTYDAAFQLAAYLFTRIQREGLGQQIDHLEIIYRGWGAGREAVTKALLGIEGTVVRDNVVRVMDKTRIKFGGTRSPKPRRLG